MNFLKQNGVYTIGWVIQVNTNYNPAVGAVFQQWLSPKWVTASASSYAVYFCSTSTANAVSPATGLTTTATASPTYISTVDLQTIGTQTAGATATVNVATDTLKGATLAPAAPLVWQSASWSSSPSNVLSCMGTRGTDDVDSKTGMNKI